MDFGICVASKIDEVGLIAHMENLGYSHAWVADTQMMWSDCYAVLALAAQQTRSIRIGTGVAVAGTRIAPVTANSIATINRLAPGRTFLGLGTGNTAMRVMGHRPFKMREYEDYIRDVKSANPQQRMIQPAEIGALAAFLCRDEAVGITMQDLTVSAGSLW